MGKDLTERGTGRWSKASRSPRLRFSAAARQLALGALASLALALCPSTSCGCPASGNHIVIVESIDAAGTIDRNRLMRILQQVCSELHIGESAIPEIVLIHLTNEEGYAGGVPAGKTVMVERSSVNVDGKGDAMPARFLVWIVGTPDDQKMVGALAHVLRLHLQLKLSDRDLLLAEGRILQRLNSTVDVNAFVKPRQ